MSCGLPDLYAVICNFAVPTKTASQGTRAFLTWTTMGSPDNARLRFQSRGGRWITKYEATKRLTNLRVKTIPPAHPLYREANASNGIVLFLSPLMAEQHAAYYRTACAQPGQPDELVPTPVT